MGPSDRPSLPERVTVLETLLPGIQQALKGQGDLLNEIHIQTTRLAQCLDTVNTERSRWKDPMLYVSAISVIVAILAVYHS